MLKSDEIRHSEDKIGMVTPHGWAVLPGLREPIRVRDGYIEGASGWCRVATDEEEALFAALLEMVQTAESARPRAEGEGTTDVTPPQNEVAP